MKNRILLTILMGVLVVAGWHTKLDTSLTINSDKRSCLEQAEKCRKLALYEEAAEYYEKAINIEVDQNIVDQLLEVRELFYEEEVSDTARAQLLSSLSEACQLYPKEVSYWEREIGVYLENENYDDALSVCKAAFSQNLSSDLLNQYRDQIIYSYKEGTSYVEKYQNSVNGYVLENSGENHWKWISDDGESDSEMEYAMLGGVGEKNIYACKTLDGKYFFYDTSYVKRGVIEGEPDQLGLYEEGYCPVAFGDSYALVDLYGETLVGGLAYAGSFQNGCACIAREDDNWSLINTEGKEKELSAEKIVCDEAGRYTYQDRVLAVENGHYYLYDADLSKTVGDFSCANADVLTEDGWLAFEDDNGKWGYVDMDGNVVIDPQYDEAKSFSHGVAAICTGGKWGYINRDAQVIVEPQFLSCGYASETGICYVQDESNYYTTITFRYPDLM